MLYEFLLSNENEILAVTEKKTRDLAGDGPSSALLKQGLPIFYRQLVSILKLNPEMAINTDHEKARIAQGAKDAHETVVSGGPNHPIEEAVARSAGVHGQELLRLGYTLSHVVHAYGAMCQSITETAIKKNFTIETHEFRHLNLCLDIAIAGAVSEYQSQSEMRDIDREVKNLGFLAHELRGALNSVSISYQLIKKGTVGMGGSTGFVLERGLQRIDDLIARSFTEVRLRVDPKVYVEPGKLLQLIDQIALTARVEAATKKQTLEIDIPPLLTIRGDLQLLHSAFSNLIQNAVKYTHENGKIQVRAREEETKIIFEVEDSCGGLPKKAANWFAAYEQHHENREGLGLGLTIAKRAIELHHGTLVVENLPKKGCIFRVTLPNDINATFPPSLSKPTV